jgi:hypothetical protein
MGRGHELFQFVNSSGAVNEFLLHSILIGNFFGCDRGDDKCGAGSIKRAVVVASDEN